jgi:hypothetical protein
LSQDYVSAVKRLRDLKPLFSLHDVRMRHDMSPDTARNALSRWKADSMVQPAGPRLGWYYNLIVDPRGSAAHLGEAVTAVFGAAVLIGPSVLNDRGWTPQQPHSLTVAVPWSRSYPRIEGALVYGRPAAWFLHVHEAIVHETETMGLGSYRLPSLPPEYALADMLKHRDCLHHLAPDDIGIPGDDVRIALLAQAFAALEVPPDCYDPFMRASGVQFSPGIG